MPSDPCRNELNKEYIYVRRLISVLTNDGSDKPIVEKLKGKNLTSLLYDAKIIDNSKNVAANKKILACVIRAIEREKHLCRRRELEQSWGRKLLQSFNCLYPGVKSSDDCNDQSVFSRGCSNGQKPHQKGSQHCAMSRRAKTSSPQTPNPSICRISIKRCGNSAQRGNNKLRTGEKCRNKTTSCVGSTKKNKTKSYVESVMIDKPYDKNEQRFEIKMFQTDILQIKAQNKVHAILRPPMLCQKKLNGVVVRPGHPIRIIRNVEKTDKKTSSTQTVNSSNGSDPSVQNNIKLQDLLEAATNLISTDDQREYVRSFLSNFEPPFDLSAGFPPYLKLPMKKSDDLLCKESIYGSNSEFSLRSGRRLSPARPFQGGNEVMNEKEENVKKYVMGLADPCHDAAESIISGVINETLPHEKADYSRLGACILKRLGAYPPGMCREKVRRTNLNIPEIVLQCTEFFESDGNDETNGEVIKINDKPGKNSSGSIAGVHERGETKDATSWDGQMMQNYCFFESEVASHQRVELLNMSQSSLMAAEEPEIKQQHLDDGGQDRKNFQLREPLKITPSGLDHGSRRPKKMTCERKCDLKMASGRGAAGSANPPVVNSHAKEPIANKTRQKVSIYTVTSEKKEGLSTAKQVDESATIESISILPNSDATPAETTTELPHKPIASEKSETEPPEPAQLQWEATVTEIETFDGVGEASKKLTDPPTSKADKKPPANKSRSFQDKLRGRKKCKSVTKRKHHSDKNDVDLSKNCRVM